MTTFDNTPKTVTIELPATGKPRVYGKSAGIKEKSRWVLWYQQNNSVEIPVPNRPMQYRINYEKKIIRTFTINPDGTVS